MFLNTSVLHSKTSSIKRYRPIKEATDAALYRLPSQMAEGVKPPETLVGPVTGF